MTKHYAVTVEVCPPRRGNHKRVVEKANHAARSCPRSTAHTGPPPSAGSLTPSRCGRSPPPFPVTTQVARTVTAQGLVAYAGNVRSVPPQLAQGQVIVSTRHGSGEIHIASQDAAGGGPRRIAMAGGDHVTVEDSGAFGQWPGWAQACAPAGFASAAVVDDFDVVRGFEEQPESASYDLVIVGTQDPDHDSTPTKPTTWGRGRLRARRERRGRSLVAPRHALDASPRQTRAQPAAAHGLHDPNVHDGCVPLGGGYPYSCGNSPSNGSPSNGITF